ncbi:MAG: ArsR/SmtB family transcription factor, partial [Halobacteriales archaeon]
MEEFAAPGGRISPSSRDRQYQEAILSLLNDEYARDILDALGRESLSARELTDRMDASRPTVYRRLDSLEEAGVVESTMQIHPEGHHRASSSGLLSTTSISRSTPTAS